jgi:outer membrane protein, multidrug efflux system
MLSTLAHRSFGRRIGYRARSMLVCATAGAALVACSTTRPYQRPEIATPDEWRNSDHAQSAAWPSMDWWHAFGSSQLDTLIAQGRQESFDIAAAVARIRQADAQVGIANAQLWPSLALQSGFSHDGGRSNARSGFGTNSTSGLGTNSQSGFGTAPTSGLQHLALSASYELDFWGKNRDGLASAQAAALASRYDRDTIELSTTSSIALTYFQVLALREREAVAKDNLASAESILRILRGRLAAGIATALDVAQQETVVSTVSASIPPLEAQLQQNSDALAILIGKLPQALDLASDSLANISVPPVTAGIPSELLTRRPDVAEAEAQLVAANADVAAARAAFLPNVQLTATAGFESAALASLLNPASAMYTLAASLAQPIFDAGQLKGQYHASQGRYEELVQMYQKAAVSAFGDVEDALAASRAAAAQEAEQQAATAAARRAHEISVAQLRAGTVDLMTVLNAQSALFAAEDALVEVRLATLQAAVSLYKALGGGWRTTRDAQS